MYKTNKSKSTAFTLIELLVVISIISLLMAISIPSLNHARKNGISTVCLSNIRQLTFAWIVYAADNNERMCSPETDWNQNKLPWWEEDTASIYGGPYNHWVSDGPGLPYNNYCNTETAFELGVLWSYLETSEIYRCPDTDKNSGRSYAISHAMGSASNFNGEWNFYSTNEVPTPSQKMVFIDHESPVRDPDGWMLYVGDGSSVILIDTYSNTWIVSTAMSPITCRHNDRTNMSFADGHAEHWKWMDRRTIRILNRECSREDYSNNNPDILRLLPLVKGARDRQF